MKLRSTPLYHPPALDFVGQNLQGRSFRGQDLTGANFSRANLQGADFTDAVLVEANFTYAKLQGTNFTRAQLTQANFSQATAGLRAIHQYSLWAVSSLLAVLAGFGGSLAASWVMNLVVSDNKLLQFGTTGTSLYSIVAGFVTIEILLVILVVICRSGLGATFRIGGLNALLVGLPISIGMGVLTAAKLIPGQAGSGEAATGVGGAIAMAIFLAMSSILLLALMAAIQESCLWVGGAATLGALAVIYINLSPPLPPPLMFYGMIVWAIILILSALRVSQRAISNHIGYQSIRNLATIIQAQWGTKFYRASLAQADFSGADLKYADLRGIDWTHTLWCRSGHLDQARVGNTILQNPLIRNLLVTGNGQQQSYRGLNLRGANLTQANLSGADLSGADLSQSLLHHASLEGATLTQTQVVGTDLMGANLTAACGLGTWNIDSTTQLGGVNCRWIYLLETPKPQTDDRERRPSSGEFAPDEFTSLFREVIDTVDLIFRHGIDQRAFSHSLQRVQTENNLAHLELQSLENQGNGVVIARLRTSPDADKSIIHGQFMQIYQDTHALYHQQQGVLEQHNQQIQTLYEKVEQLTKRTAIDQFVLLQIHPGDFETGFAITLQIFRYEDGVAPLSAQTQGSLPHNPQIYPAFQYWQAAYRRSLKAARLEVPSQVTNVSSDEFFGDCLQAQNSLSEQINNWLASDTFRPIERALHIQLDRDQPIRILLQTEQIQLRQLPWQSWRFFQDYAQAELALSKPNYHSPVTIERESASKTGNSVKILAILGNSRGIDLQKDQAALDALNADVTFLIEPQRRDLSETLRAQPWDILFFAGHSQTDGSTGKLWLNETEHLSIGDIQSALIQAISRGLKLAIFNSCDGLGLANELADLQIPDRKSVV